MEYSPFFMLLGLIVFFEAFYCYYYYYFNLFDFPFWKRKGPLIPSVLLGFPGGASGREPARQCRRRQRHREDPWVVRSLLEEEMATRSRILVWRIPWPQEAGGLQSAGSESDMTEQLTHIRQSVLQISRSLDLGTTDIWNGCFLFRGGGGGSLLCTVGSQQHPWPLPSVIQWHLPAHSQDKHASAQAFAKSLLLGRAWEARTQWRTACFCCISVLWDLRGTVALLLYWEKATLSCMWLCFLTWRMDPVFLMGLVGGGGL